MTWQTIRSATSLVSALSRWRRAGKTVARDVIVSRSFQTLTVEQRHRRRYGVTKHLRKARPTSASKDLDQEAVVDVVLRQPRAIHQCHTSRRASMKVEFRLESPVCSGHTEGPKPIGETSTTGTRQRVRMMHGPISDCNIRDINSYLLVSFTNWRNSRIIKLD